MTAAEQIEFLPLALAGEQGAPGCVQFKQQLPLLGTAHPALDPAHRHQPLPLPHRLDAVQQGAGVHQGMAGRQAHGLLASGGFEHQFAALVVRRIAEEYGQGEVGAPLHHVGVVNVTAIALPGRAAAEAQAVDPLRQGCRLQQRVGLQGLVQPLGQPPLQL